MVPQAQVQRHVLRSCCDTPQDVQDTPGALALADVRGAVEFRDVRFSYRPDFEVLLDFGCGFYGLRIVLLVNRPHGLNQVFEVFR